MISFVLTKYKYYLQEVNGIKSVQKTEAEMLN